MRTSRRVALLLFLSVCAACCAHISAVDIAAVDLAKADEPTVGFASEVWPILESRCLDCHRAPHRLASGVLKKPKGRVTLDSAEGMRSSQRGKVLRPGDPEGSLLFQVISLPENDEERMPPVTHGAALTEEEIALIQLWITEGAHFGDWKGTTASTGESWGNQTGKRHPPITALAFAPDGESIVAASQRGLQVLRWPSLELTKTIALQTPNLHHLTFSPNGDSIAIGGGDPSEAGVVELLSWPQGEVVRRVGDHEDSVFSGEFRDDSAVLTAGFDKRIVLWNLPDGMLVREFKGHSRGVTSLCWLPEKRTFVSGSIDQSLRVWDAETGALIRSLNQHTGSIHDLALKPGDDALPMVASSASDRTIRFWQPTIGRMVRYARLPSEALSLVWIDEETIAASCRDGQLRIVDAFTVETRHEIPAVTKLGYSMAVHPSDGSVAIGGLNGEIRRLVLPRETE